MSDPAPAITYTLAVHNSAGFMADHVRRVAQRLHAYPRAEILLVENGSNDASPELARSLAGNLSDERVSIRVETVPKGLGYAHRRGLAMARGDVVVVIGVDLPFGFDDLDQWESMAHRPALVLGSKSHPDSRVDVSASRKLFSSAFRLARRMILGLGPADTQGSIIIDGDLGRRIAPHLVCTDYLVTTEIVAWAAHFGARPVEIPVTYARPAASTVSPLRDGYGMLRGMLSLRRRLQRESAHAIGAAGR